MKGLIGLMMWALSLNALAQVFPSPLLDAQWLLQSKPANLVVLDIQEPQLFARHHIDGAVNWPFSQWRTGAQASPPKSLPPLMILAERLGRLGITRETPVVIVSTGAGPGDMSAAARVYWTLSVLGHEQLAVLNGGLVAYVNGAGGRYVRGKAEARDAVVYSPKPNQALLATRDDIVALPEQPFLDARSHAEFVGLVAPEGERPGTLKGARHLPYDWLVGDDGRVRGNAQVQKLFDHAGADAGGSVHFCHTGNRASLTWFAEYAMLGRKDARLYDASMLEWASEADTPLQLHLDLALETH